MVFLCLWLWSNVVFVHGIKNKCGNTGIEPWENPSESLCLGEDPLGPPCVSLSPWVAQIGHFIALPTKN